MSKDCTEGSVLTQQTVLGFSAHPPSPFGASSLPHCIAKQRGGQQSFAMNQHTQLQFNLGIPPHPTNLETHFDPSRPTPVVIEKPSFAPGLNGGEFRTISAKKLALAVRLAKRDLRMGRFQSPPPTMPSPSTQPCPICRDEQCGPPSTICCDERSVEPHIPPAQAADINRSEMKKEVVVGDTEEPLPQRTPYCSNERSVIQSETVLSPLVDKEGNQRRRDDRSSQEVLRLRNELQRQVAYIKQLRELGRGLGHVTSTRHGNSNNKRGVRVVESGRVWMDEGRSEEEKLLQREEEQAARNARTIYNLSHQLSRLQQDMQRLQLGDSTGNNKKNGAIRRLATIYRSALRLLQSYQSPGHTPQPLPPELGLLLQQLSLLSHHFGVGGAKSELDTTLKLLQGVRKVVKSEGAGTQTLRNLGIKELVEQGKENESITRQPVREKNAVSRNPAVQKLSKPKSAKKTTGFSHRPLHVVPRSVRTRRGRGRVEQPPHFAQQTLASRRRQQAKQTNAATRHSPMIHSTPALLHSSTPFTSHSVKRHQMEPLLSRNGTTPLPSTSQCDMVGDQKQGNSTASHSVPSSPTDVATGVSTSRQKGSVSPCLVTDNKKTPKISINSPVDQHRETAGDEPDGNSPERGGRGGVGDEQRMWMEGISATLAHHSQQLETFKKNTQKQLGQLQEKLSSQRKTRKKSEEDTTPTVEPRSDGSEKSEETEGGSFDGRKLEGLMERLRELEGEEEVIRERWRTIVYEDPPLAKPPILHPSEQHPASKNDCPPPGLPDDALQRITSYRQRFQHHLLMTGHNTQGGFNPWNMAERLADDLLSEVVDQVADELGELCDGYVDRLFSSEFVKPQSHSPTPSND